MKNVQLLLNKEKQAKEAIVQAQNVLANIGQEKEELGIQILAEAKEKLDILEVGYLLNANIAERVMAPVRITRLDGRVLKLRARKQDVERISLLETQRKELQQTINDLIQEVAELKESDEKIADLEKQLKETQDKLDAAKKKEQEYADAIKDYVSAEKTAKKQEEQNNDNSNILREVIASKDKYIAELESKLADKAYQAANDGYLVDGVEISLAVVNELNDEIEKLREEMAEKEAAISKLNKKVKALELINEAPELDEVATEIDFNDNGYMELLASQEAQYVNIPTETIITGIEKQQETKDIKPEVKGPEFVKTSAAVFSKNSRAKLYQTESCYFIASPYAKEITWLSYNTLTEEYKQQVIDRLVKDFNFNASRVELSPIVIQDSISYMARTHAHLGVETYSIDDVYCGYVKKNNDFILYSYFPNTNKMHIESLNKKLLMAEGKLSAKNTMPDDKKVLAFVNSKVRNMYKKYKEQTSKILDAQQQSAAEATEQFNANQSRINEILQSNAALVNAAAKNNPELAAALDKKGDEPKPQAVALTGSLAALADEF